jgi:putative NADH-flavin reductase
MKIALLGATGWIGGVVAKEALGRGHALTAVVRDPSRLTLRHERLTVTQGDAADPASVVAALVGHDAAVAAIGGRSGANHQVVPAAAAMLAGLPEPA